MLRCGRISAPAVSDTVSFATVSAGGEQRHADTVDLVAVVDGNATLVDDLPSAHVERRREALLAPGSR
jgi:hypothetical protein